VCAQSTLYCIVPEQAPLPPCSSAIADTCFTQRLQAWAEAAVSNSRANDMVTHTHLTCRQIASWVMMPLSRVIEMVSCRATWRNQNAH